MDPQKYVIFIHVKSSLFTSPGKYSSVWAKASLPRESSKISFGFNGKENDNEVAGAGNWQDYGMRLYSPRLGRFPSVDPLTKDYPWYTPFQFAGNTPIQAIDLDGEEEFKHYSYFNTCGELYATKLKLVSADGMRNDGGKHDQQTVQYINVYFDDKGDYYMLNGETRKGSTTGTNAFKDENERKIVLQRDLSGETLKMRLKTPIPFTKEGDQLPSDLVTKTSSTIVKENSNAVIKPIYYNDEDKPLKVGPGKTNEFVYFPSNSDGSSIKLPRLDTKALPEIPMEEK